MDVLNGFDGKGYLGLSTEGLLLCLGSISEWSAADIADLEHTFALCNIEAVRV